MSRSFSNGLARAIVRGMKEAERERKRAQKAQQRAYEKQVREQNKIRKKEEKERYIESRYVEAVDQTEILINNLDKYNEIIERVSYAPLFRFDNYRKVYKEKEFTFRESSPIEVEPELQEVPDDSWLDKVFYSRVVKRNNIIEANEKEVERVKTEYEQRVKAYGDRKEKSYNSWVLEEQRRKKEIETKNQEINSWEELFYEHDEEAVTNFIEVAFANDRHFIDTVKEIENSYNRQTKVAIIEIRMKSKDEIFPYEGYKYFKTRDSIEPVKMKVKESTRRLKDLMLNIAISSFYIVFRNVNTKVNIVEEVVVNVIHDGVCCVSGRVSMEELNKLNLNVSSNYDALLDNHMRIMKQLARGVKPFERIYTHLGL